MKELEIPFVFEKTENKAIFGSCDAYHSRNWITLDDSKSLNERKNHLLVFNFRTEQLDLDGMNTNVLSCDTIDIKPSIKAYMILERCLRKKGYIFNKKLSTIEKIPTRVG